MNQQQERLMRYLTEQSAACLAKQQALAADERRDEAAFEQIRANIFEVFRTVLTTAQNTCGDDAAIQTFFVQRLAQIPGAWTNALNEARAHHDTHQQHLQHVKLGVVQEIRREMARWEVEAP